jgi:hypothetical protein
MNKFIIGLIALFVLIKCSSDDTTTTTTTTSNTYKEERDKDIAACIQRGYAYFDELGYGKGNYKLSNGQMRDDTVLIRCERQPKTAF